MCRRDHRNTALFALHFVVCSLMLFAFVCPLLCCLRLPFAFAWLFHAPLGVGGFLGRWGSVWLSPSNASLHFAEPRKEFHLPTCYSLFALCFVVRPVQCCLPFALLFALALCVCLARPPALEDGRVLRSMVWGGVGLEGVKHEGHSNPVGWIVFVFS